MGQGLFLALAVLVLSVGPLGVLPQVLHGGGTHAVGLDEANMKAGGGTVSAPARGGDPWIGRAEKAVAAENPPPTTLLTITGALGMEGWYLSSVTIALLGEDENGPVSTAYKIGGGPWQAYHSPFLLTDDGIHLLEYFSTDALGASEAPRQREIRIDATPPQTTLLLDGVLGQGGWYTSAVLALPAPVDVTSGVKSLQFRVDGSPWADLPPPLLLSSNGEHTIEFFATDVAGNAEIPRSRSVKLDRERPGVTIERPANGSLFQASTVDVAWTGQDGVSGLAVCRASLDGKIISSEPSVALRLTDLGDGPHALRVACFDEAGNGGEATVSFRVDTHPLSPSGPLGPWLLVALTLVPAVVATLLIRRRRRAAGVDARDE